MNSNIRREQILEKIIHSEKPISASALANQFQVSRQLIVGDVALLRASGKDIFATPRGYVCEEKIKNGIERTIVVSHNEDELASEIYTVIDLGGAMLDVIVDHPLYGQLCGKLHLFSRYDAEQFLLKTSENKARPLSNLTKGLHLHTIRCHDEETMQRIIDALDEKGFLYNKE